MPGYQRIRIGGQDYEVPEENLEKTLELLDSKGVAFGDSDEGEQASAVDDGRMEPGGPDATKTSQVLLKAPSRAPEKPTEHSWASALAEGAKDASLGALRGATFGFDDDIIGALGGDAQLENDIQDAAAKRSPWAHGLADMAGSMVIPIPGTTAARGASLAARAGRAALEGGITGGLRGAGDAEGDDRWSEALSGAGIGAPIGGGVAGLMGKIGHYAGRASDALNIGADRARIKAWNVPDDVIAAKAERMGVTPSEASSALAREGEQMAPPNRLMPRSNEDYFKAFQSQARGLNGEIVGAIDEATARGAQLPTNPRQQVANELYGQADAAFDSAHGAPQSRVLDSVAGDISQGGQQYTPHDVRAQKIGFDENAFGGAPGTPESMRGQANLAAANEYRSMLGNYVDQGGDDLATDFAAKNDAYATAATLRNSNFKADTATASGGGWLGAAAGAGGAALGGMVGGLPGAVMGAGAGYQARKALSSPEVLANAGRSMSDGAAAFGRGAEWIGEQAPDAARAYAALAGEVGMQQRTDRGPSSTEKPIDSGRGQFLAHAAQQNPDVLGPYLSEFSNLQDEQRVAADIERLSHDPTKQDFARKILPQLRRMTGQR